MCARYIRRHLQQGIRVVEDDPEARVDEIVRDSLGRGRRHGEHADDDVLLLDYAAQRVVGPHRQIADALADLLRLHVEDRHDPETVVGKYVRARYRLAEVAGAEQRDVVLARRTQDLPDLRHQRVDVVTDTPLAELSEARQIAPDLSRVDVCSRKAPARRSSPCPSSWPGSGPADSGQARRNAKREALGERLLVELCVGANMSSRNVNSEFLRRGSRATPAGHRHDARRAPLRPPPPLVSAHRNACGASGLGEMSTRSMSKAKSSRTSSSTSWATSQRWQSGFV